MPSREAMLSEDEGTVWGDDIDWWLEETMGIYGDGTVDGELTIGEVWLDYYY